MESLRKTMVAILSYIILTMLVYFKLLLPFDKTFTSALPVLSEKTYFIVLFITLLADFYVVLLGILIYSVYLFFKHGNIPRNFTFLIISIILVSILTTMFKILIGIPRPQGCQLAQQSIYNVLLCYSYPSGHVSRFTVITYYVSKRSKVTKIYMYMLLICIGLSRILLQAHYLSDVIGGFLLGLIISFIMGKRFER